MVGTPEMPSTLVVHEYTGRLVVFRTPLGAFLTGEAWNIVENDSEPAELIESLLATIDENMGLDWKQREVLQARLKVACRRVLMRFGAEAIKAEEIAEKLVTWARIQIPDDLGAEQQAT